MKACWHVALLTLLIRSLLLVPLSCVLMGQQFLAVAIAAQAGEQFVGPCGACRQFMAEFNPDIPIYLVRPDLEVQVTNLNVLLPEAFTPRRMELKFHSNGTNKVNGTNGTNGTNG